MEIKTQGYSFTKEWTNAIDFRQWQILAQTLFWYMKHVNMPVLGLFTEINNFHPSKATSQR